VLMYLKMAPRLDLIVLLMISGALGNEWSLNYSQEKLCALKGSTVVLRATYTHPTDVTVERVFWVIDPVKGRNLTDLRNDSSYSGRVEYLEGEQNHFSLRLRDVKKSDKHNYCCRIITNEDKERYLGYPGVILRVTDLQLIAPAEVTEGESVILTCKTTCSLTDPTFIWYKNTHDLTTNTFKSNKLHLQRVSSEDAGSYNCAVRGSEHLPSPAHNLSVRYPPKSVSVSISHSGERVEDNPVNLTCSSDANPPVENYTWFKENESSPVGSGQILIMTMNYTISKISSEDNEKYKCMCSNEVGHQNSTSVTLNVLYPPKNVSVSISSSGEKVEGTSVTLTCSSDSNPPVENYTWFKENETSPVGSGQSYRALQSGLYYCEVQNKLGSERSAAVSITITDAGDRRIIQMKVTISLFGEEVGKVLLNLTCSSDSNPPVENYTWFKENEASPVGSGQSYRALQSGLYYCEAQNKLGSERSAAVSITITDPPKNISVSISLSGEIVEGSSVNLTCSCDANPPVETYTWFNETSSVGKGITFTISKVRSEDSGKYKCMCSNKVGHQNSTSVTLNI
ncbi:B-cell receptor CD22-like, partial [Silurus asotus]